MPPKALICPHCGGSVFDRSALSAGSFNYSESGGFCVYGERVNLSEPQEILIRTIMEASGGVVGPAALAKAIKTKAADKDVLVRVQLHNIKSAIESSGIFWPITVKRGFGWWWSGPRVVRDINP